MGSEYRVYITSYIELVDLWLWNESKWSVFRYCKKWRGELKDSIS